MMKSLRWDVCCNTGSLRKHKPSVPCSISLSNIYVSVQACRRNIMSSTNLVNREKVNQAFFSRSFFVLLQNLPTWGQDAILSILPSFLLFRVLYHQSILSFTLVCLSKVYRHFVLPNVMKDLLLIASYFAEVVSKNLIS